MLNFSQDNRQEPRSSNQGRQFSVNLLTESRLETRRIATSRTENFVVASFLLPKAMRQSFYDIYAFCRVADDLSDDSPSPAVALTRLDDFQRQLDDLFANRAVEGLFVALADTIDRYSLPKQPFDDLLDAFRQDQRKTRYADIDEVLEYCQRSACPVGRILLHLTDCVDPQNTNLSDRLCIGLQLTNFLQDVARDLQIKRVYLPEDQMQRFGVHEAMLYASTSSPEFRQLLKSECDRASDYLHQGLELANHVPRWFAADIRLFAHGGLATLNAIRRVEFDVLSRRPTVSRWRQAAMIARAAVGLL